MTSHRRAATIAALLPAALLVASLASPQRLGAASLYDSALGLPGSQGWAETVLTDPPAALAADIGPDGLHFSTLPFSSTGGQGAALWWTRDDFDFDFTQDFAVELNVRIVSAPDHVVNVPSGWPRPGYGLAISDVSGRFLWMGLGSGEVFLSHTAYGQYNSSNTVHAAFNTTDQHHVYRIERGPGGVGAVLRVDGVVLLTLTTLGSPDGSGGPSIYFGDLTYWANSESHTLWVRAFTPTLDVGPRESSEVLWARAVGGASSRPGIAYGTGLAGSLSFELFDPAGRRVEQALREVSAGESGRFETPDALRGGLYFYRVRLAPASGREVERSGKLVVVR